MRAEPELADDVVEGTVHQPLSVGSRDVEDDGHMRLDVDYLKHIGWRRHDRYGIVIVVGRARRGVANQGVKLEEGIIVQGQQRTAGGERQNRITPR
jgi:hypothetical protein